MSINFNVDNSIKSAKDIFVGVNTAKRRVVKVLTSINSEKRVIYEYTNPPTIQSGYYYVSNPTTGQTPFVHTKDFVDYDIIPYPDEFNGVASSICYTDDGKFYFFRDVNNVMKFCVYDENGMSSLVDTDLPYKYSGTSYGGSTTGVFYYKGVFYYGYTYLYKSGSYYYNRYFMYASTDATHWTQIHTDSKSEGSDASKIHPVYYYILGFMSDSSGYNYLFLCQKWQINTGGTNRTPLVLKEKDGVFSTASALAVNTGVEIVTDVGNNVAYSQTHKIEANNGTLTYTALTNDTRIASYPCYYDGDHFYGVPCFSKSSSSERNLNFYLDTTQVGTQSSSLPFKYSCLTEDGVVFMGYDSSSSIYKVFKLNKSGTISQIAENAQTPYQNLYADFLSFKSIIYIPE